MKRLSTRQALYLSLGVIVLMWLVKVIKNTFFIDRILALGESIQTFARAALTGGLWTVLVVTVLLYVSRETYRDIGFDGQRIVKQLGIGLLGGLLIFVLNAVVVSTLVDVLLPDPGARVVDLSRFFGSLSFLPVWVVMALFKAGFAEELLRVFTLSRFEKGFGSAGLVFALIVGSVVFGFGHLYQGAGGMVQAATRGLLYGLVYLRKRRALEASFAHASYDLINVTLGYLLYYGQ